MKSMLFRVDNLMASMGRITENNAQVRDQVSAIVEEGRTAIQCLDADIKEMEQSLNDAKDSVLSMRSLVTTVVIAIPLVIAVSHPVLKP